MENFKVPQREEVNETNQQIFDKLKDQLGFVPNLYATIAHSDTGLENYLNLQGAPSSLSTKEKEVVNLVVSQVNGCRYCQSAHTAVGKMNGFSDDEILEIRSGSASFNPKLDALARLTAEIASNRGRIDDTVLEAFFDAGFTKASLVDVTIVIGEKIIMNYLHNVTGIPIDFPLAPELETTHV